MRNMFNMGLLDPENVHIEQIEQFCQSNPQEPWSTLKAAVSLKFEDDLDMVVDVCLPLYVYHCMLTIYTLTSKTHKYWQNLTIFTS
jgi:hypothetical protein